MNAFTPIIRCAGKLVLILCAALPGAVAQGGDANVQKAGYDKIAQRNMFGLISAPDGVVTDTAQPAAPAQVKLSGITTVLGQKRAFFVVHGAAEGGKAKDENYMLTVGQRQNGYELLDLDEKAGTARLRADGRLLVLSLASPKLPTAAAVSVPAPSQSTAMRQFPARTVARPPAAAPPVPSVPGLPDTGSNADSQSDADLAGRP